MKRKRFVELHAGTRKTERESENLWCIRKIVSSAESVGVFKLSILEGVSSITQHFFKMDKLRDKNSTGSTNRRKRGESCGEGFRILQVGQSVAEAYKGIERIAGHLASLV
jgi:hypothetical protein